ncbi:MAG TPA: hypothetical protein VNT79_00350, partial [Phycisphaerae bacterium]|nr:hypothetical protein [Phycisphaerae bacterium]
LLVSFEPWYLSYAELCPADTNSDGSADGNDIQCFVDLLLGVTLGCSAFGDPCGGSFVAPEGGSSESDSGESPSSASGGDPDAGEGDSGSDNDLGTSPVLADCDANGIEDWIEIESGLAADCNANGFLDDCDMRFGYMISSDCNDNGAPDECDIEGDVSIDVNLNGYPDECDAIEEIDLTPREWSDDAEAMAALLDFGDYDAQAEFYEWCGQQEWGPGATLDGSPVSGSAQFHRLIEKRRELGLPLSNPHGLRYPINAN